MYRVKEKKKSRCFHCDDPLEPAPAALAGELDAEDEEGKVEEEVVVEEPKVEVPHVPCKCAVCQKDRAQLPLPPGFRVVRGKAHCACCGVTFDNTHPSVVLSEQNRLELITEHRVIAKENMRCCPVHLDPISKVLVPDLDCSSSEDKIEMISGLSGNMRRRRRRRTKRGKRKEGAVRTRLRRSCHR